MLAFNIICTLSIITIQFGFFNQRINAYKKERKEKEGKRREEKRKERGKKEERKEERERISATIYYNSVRLCTLRPMSNCVDTSMYFPDPLAYKEPFFP